MAGSSPAKAMKGCFYLNRFLGKSGGTTNRAQFVAIGIAEIGEIGPAWANAGRIFGGCAAIRDAGRVPRVALFGIAHREADSAAVGTGCRLAVDGLGHHQAPAIMRVTQPAFGVLSAGLAADRDKQGIVEFLRPGDVVTPDHNMAEHFRSLLIRVSGARRLRPPGRTRFAGGGSMTERGWKILSSLSPSPRPLLKNSCDGGAPYIRLVQIADRSAHMPQSQGTRFTAEPL